jgi:hypothetical protein
LAWNSPWSPNETPANYRSLFCQPLREDLSIRLPDNTVIDLALANPPDTGLSCEQIHAYVDELINRHLYRTVILSTQIKNPTIPAKCQDTVQQFFHHAATDTLYTERIDRLLFNMFDLVNSQHVLGGVTSSAATQDYYQGQTECSFEGFTSRISGFSCCSHRTASVQKEVFSSPLTADASVCRFLH